MTHFICKGECNGTSDTPGLCQADGTTCSQAGQPLNPCECDNNMHGAELPPEATTEISEDITE